MNTRSLISRFAFAVTACVATSAVAVEKAPTRDELAFFEKNIRPVLVAKCYKCHSAESEKVKGGLLVDTRDAIRAGGDTGHAVVPGSLGDSLLISAMRGVKKAELMPPKEKLPEDVIANFEKWILMGAPDPRDGTAKSVAKKWNIEEGKNFWAFQPVKPQTAPATKDSKWPAGDIDRFVLAKLEEKNLKPVGDAEAHTLIRRIYFDLVGIPPTPEQAESFVKECQSAGANRQAAIAKVTDQLLASPQFGERWGRHWLDVARYAESTGRERNYTYTQAWRYRDYVIASLNADKPYDQFIREQIAGDLLPAKNIAQRNEQIIATGFLAMGPKGLNEKNREQFNADNVDEQIDVTTRAVMAVTVSCARCHDHKFDPISTHDYYAMAGIFRSTENCYGTADGNGGKNRQPGRLITLAKESTSVVTQAPAPAPAAEKSGAKSSKLTPEQEARLARMASANPQVAKRLNSMTDAQKIEALERFQGSGKAKNKKTGGKYAKGAVEEKVDPTAERVMGVREGSVADAPIYIRGEVNERGAIVPRGLVQVLSTVAPAPKMPANQSGRLELAQWLTASENPLTARVMANRVWQHLLGDGIVSTADNFGATGERPTHPELLDYLATRLMANHWSVKSLIREVVLSRTYQLSSANDSKNFNADPDNSLLWHASQRRLDAESIRDAALAVGGQLDLVPPHGSPVTALGDTDIGRNRSAVMSNDSKKRSVYLPIVRDMVPPVLDLFDFAEPSLVVANRDVTTVPSQALFMLNSPFIYDNSAQMAKRLLALPNADDSRRITTAYLTALSRTPNAAELARAESYLSKHTTTAGASRDTAWATFCQALLASAEFRYIN